MTYVCVFCGKPVTQDYEPETFPCCGVVGQTMPEDEYEACTEKMKDAMELEELEIEEERIEDQT